MTGRLDDVVARKVGHLSRSAVGLIAPASISRNIDPGGGGSALHHGGDSVPISTHSACLATWRAWQRFHMGWRYTPNPHPSGRGWVDIAYTIGVCQHGYTLAGRGAGIRTAANGTNTGNLRYYAIVWIGGARQVPTQAALDAIAQAILELRAAGAGDRVVGHTDLKPTACPHPTLLSLARRLDRRPIPRTSTPPPPVRSWFEMATKADLAEVVRDTMLDLRIPLGPAARRLYDGAETQRWRRLLEVAAVHAHEANVRAQAIEAALAQIVGSDPSSPLTAEDVRLIIDRAFADNVVKVKIEVDTDGSG